MMASNVEVVVGHASSVGVVLVSELVRQTGTNVVNCSVGLVVAVFHMDWRPA